MSINPRAYRTLVFDCDGVVLNSNRLKTDAFRVAAMPYGEDAADAMVQYHVANGGVSRYRKFEYLLNEIVPGRSGPDLDMLVRSYSDAVLCGLMECDVAANIRDLRAETRQATWMIVSGGDQSELRDVFLRRGLSDLFDGGIYGSPDPKEEIMDRLQKAGRLTSPALYLGDSIYDHQVAVGLSIDFLFVSGWSEVVDWPGFVKANALSETSSIGDLVCRGGVDKTVTGLLD
nr:HAD family hydrolase [uncultured Celeribacter sp.]